MTQPESVESASPSGRDRGLDRAFFISLVLKGLDAVVEVVGAILLLAVSPTTWNNLVVRLTRHELSQDPHDFIARHLLHVTANLSHTRAFGATYLLIHGLVKIVLVVALWRRLWWAYPVALAVFGLFIAYQLYRLVLDPTLGMVALTLFDAVVIWLIWREYRAHLRTA
jgi:uncharacterized membrane protein